MAFENLEPFRGEILALRKPGPDQKTLIEVSDYLFEKHKLRTTPGTLSRYLKELRHIAPDRGLRDPTPAERDRLEAVALLTEVLVEVRGTSEEQRAAIEHLAGQVAVNTRAIEELEKSLSTTGHSGGPIPSGQLRSIWARAFLVCGLVAAAIAALVIWYARH